MATSTGPDLTVAKEAVEALMDDTCTITSASDSDDSVLDPVTGEIVNHPPTATYDGPCKVKPNSEARPIVIVEGGAHSNARFYRGALPLEAPSPELGSILRITSSRRDPELVGLQFFVREVQFSTFAIQRKLVLELREAV